MEKLVAKRCQIETQKNNNLAKSNQGKNTAKGKNHFAKLFINLFKNKLQKKDNAKQIEKQKPKVLPQKSKLRLLLKKNARQILLCVFLCALCIISAVCVFLNNNYFLARPKMFSTSNILIALIVLIVLVQFFVPMLELFQKSLTRQSEPKSQKINTEKISTSKTLQNYGKNWQENKSGGKLQLSFKKYSKKSNGFFAKLSAIAKNLSRTDNFTKNAICFSCLLIAFCLSFLLKTLWLCVVCAFFMCVQQLLQIFSSKNQKFCFWSHIANFCFSFLLLLSIYLIFLLN